MTPQLSDLQGGPDPSKSLDQAHKDTGERTDTCGRSMVGSATDTYATCDEPEGHTGSCKCVVIGWIVIPAVEATDAI